MDSEQSTHLEEASQILLLASGLDKQSHKACAELISSKKADSTLLAVSFTRSVDEQLQTWQPWADDDFPETIGIITVDERVRSTAENSATITTSPALSTRPISIETVPSPANLTRLGTLIVDYLSEWETDETSTVVCFDSITPLLQYVDSTQVYRFLHTLGGHIRRTNAVAHYHMDPVAHDEQTVALFKSLVDAVVEIEESGSWTITTASVD